MSDDTPHLPAHTHEPHEEFPDVDQTDEGERAAIEATKFTHIEKPTSEFYEELLQNPQYAKETAIYKGVVGAYARGESVQNICDTFGVTRTEVALAVRLAGVHRGMDTYSMAPEDVANLYALLYAAQLEIESLRRRLGGV